METDFPLQYKISLLIIATQLRGPFLYSATSIYILFFLEMDIFEIAITLLKARQIRTRIKFSSILSRSNFRYAFCSQHLKKIGPQMRTWGLMLNFIPFGWNAVLKYQHLGVDLLQVKT